MCRRASAVNRILRRPPAEPELRPRELRWRAWCPRCDHDFDRRARSCPRCGGRILAYADDDELPIEHAYRMLVAESEPWVRAARRAVEVAQQRIAARVGEARQ